MEMGNVNDILHFLTQKPDGARELLPPKIMGSIPTKVITSCKRSRSLSSDADTSSSSSDCEEERGPRKRPLPVTGDSQEETVTRPKVIRMTSEELMREEEEAPQRESIIQPTPLRPVCSVFMVSYGQEDSNDREAPRVPTVITKPTGGLPLDLSQVVLPSLHNFGARFMEHRKRLQLEEYIFAERFKTTWHADSTTSDGEPVQMTVPFTTDVGDMFNSFTHDTVPLETKIRTYQYAVDKAQLLEEFKHVFSMNNPNEGRVSTSNIDVSMYSEMESRIVSTGRCPQLFQPNL